MIADLDVVGGEVVVKNIKKEGGYVTTLLFSVPKKNKESIRDVNESLIMITPAAEKRSLSSATSRSGTTKSACSSSPPHGLIPSTLW